MLLERLWRGREAARSRPRSGPEARIGQRCRVFWEEDRDWYEAVCRGWDADRQQHNLWYPYDEEVRGLPFSPREVASIMPA